MAKKTVTTTEEIDSEKEDATPESLDDDVIRALTDLEGADEVAWQIHRISEPNSGYCGEMASAELSHRSISMAYGPGLYRVKGIRPDGKYFKSGRIKVSMPSKSAEPVKPAVSGDSNALLLAMIQSNAQIVSAAIARPERTEREIPWAAIAAAIPPGLTALKEFFSNRADPMKQMMDAITLTEKLRGEKDAPAAGWADLVRDGVKSLPAVLTQLRQPNSNTPAQTSQLPLSVQSQLNASQTPEAVPPPEEDMNLRLLNWFRALTDKLVQAAQRNGNAELYAELLVEELPSELPDVEVLTLLSRNDWFEMLCMLDSRAQPYRGWFEELRNCVIETLQPDGNENDSSNDADTGTVGTTKEENRNDL